MLRKTILLVSSKKTILNTLPGGTKEEAVSKNGDIRTLIAPHYAAGKQPNEPTGQAKRCPGYYANILVSRPARAKAVMEW